MSIRRTQLFLVILVLIVPTIQAEVITLSNDYICAELQKVDNVWKLACLSRTDRSDSLELDSDEFEILYFDGRRFTVNDYRVRDVVKDDNSVSITYTRGKQQIIVKYQLADGPYLYKDVFVSVGEGEKVDRLEVSRFSCRQKASRGGFGEPIFIGDWFFGLDYPGFYSRHSDGFVEPDYYYRWFYDIDLDGGDTEYAPRDGLVTLFHFPGYAKKQPDGSWGIQSKRFVCGISKTKGDGAEPGFFEYIESIRKPVRSYLHFNDWYSEKPKAITVKDFVNGTYKALDANLSKYGAKLKAMVPDHGWQNSKTYDHIFQPKLDPTHDPLLDVSKSLEENDAKLGIWFSIDGTNNSIERGKAIGYRSAYAEGFTRDKRWMQGKDYFDILVPKYQDDLKKALRFLIADASVDYIKHDFNHNFTSNYISQRHAREACLDVTLEILDYERQLHPEIFQNFTNGSWFSPWWLAHADTLWMMSGDSGASSDWPQLSLRDGATTYRDKWFYTSFNNPERCVRPIIPIANFMTHGILFTEKKPFTDFNDILDDWANYVVMYYGRGTMLKELYISPKLLDEDHWKVLGKASAWAVENQQRLANTVYVGGNPAEGEVYGYVSWVDGRAMLTVRNPDRRMQVLKVPFDRTVYYRGKMGQDYRARVVYPFLEDMPWQFVSGEAMSVAVGGDSVMVIEIEQGKPKTKHALSPKPLPQYESGKAKNSFKLELWVPDEKLKRYDLLIQFWQQGDCSLEINGRALKANRSSGSGKWQIFSYDLADYRGQKLSINGRISSGQRDKAIDFEAWLIADRQVDAEQIDAETTLPFAISQNWRRLTQNVIER